MGTIKTLAKLTINSGLAVAGATKGGADAFADIASNTENKTLNMLATRSHKDQWRASKEVGYDYTKTALDYTADGVRSAVDGFFDMFEDDAPAKKTTGYGNLGRK